MFLDVPVTFITKSFWSSSFGAPVYRAFTLEWVNKDIGVIKITGKPENIKQINIFLPIKYVLKKIGDYFTLLYLVYC
jgi:hypothetical protein